MDIAKKVIKKDIAGYDNAADLKAYIAEATADKISIPKYTNKTIHGRKSCWKCGGSGIYSSFHGVCFACNGSGTVADKKIERVWPEGSSTEDIKRWEGEVLRRYAINQAKKRLAEVVKADMAAAKKADDAKAFLNSHEGLEDALKADNKISRDLASSLDRWGRLTEKQVALAFKLAKSEAEKAAERALAADAPTGRVVIQGEVVSVKERWNGYDYAWKMVLKAKEGFKVWVSVPASILKMVDDVDQVVGMNVSIKATLEPSKGDPKFAFGKRPVVVAPPSSTNCWALLA